MSERDLEARLDAVERALTDGETDLAGLEEAADLASGVERLEERVESLESTVADLDAAVQAVRGYAGNVRAVNRDVERRASAALAKAETLESAIEDPDSAGTRDGDGDGNGTGHRDDPSRNVDGTGAPAETADPGGTHDRRGDHSPGTGSDRGGSGAGTGTVPGSDSGPESAPGIDSGSARSTATPTGPDGGPGTAPSKYSREHRTPEGRERSDARSDRGYAVGDVDGRSADENRGTDGGQPRRTSQFIERVRDVL